VDRRALALALGLLIGSFGCVHNPTIPMVTADEPVTANAPKDEGPVTMRQPKPSTCVALGNFNEQSAADPRRSPAEQEQLRERARRAYQQALKIDPNDRVALVALARLYITMDDHEHAVATYRQAVKIHPDDAALWYELGMCQARQKQWEPALDSLRRATELDPEQRLYAHSLGFCLARAGHYDESVAAFAKVEGTANAHYNLARMLHHMNEDELSKQHLRLALEIKPELDPARQLLASLEKPAVEAAQPAATVAPQALYY
jgi:tetratricopeptide (TPR) repeat protein